MPLAIENLEAHGISRRAIEIWKQDGITSLLPLQEEAVMRTGVLQNKSLIVFAPTSSGKTFIAELAALKHLESSRGVIYLVPTKALAEEKYRRFTRLYKRLGYRILVATRERPETDAPALQGRFDLLVAVYEKMKSYLVQKPSLLSRAGIVIADEIQMLGEKDRGGVVDLLLTKIAQSPYRVQFLGLSAVLGDVLRIARWLDCDFLKESQRPVELHEGVFNSQDGCFYYRAFNTGEEGEEPLTPAGIVVDGELEDFYEQAVLQLTRHLTKVNKEQIMIFVPTRGISRLWAEKLAASLELPPARSAVGELEKFEETHGREVLLSCFRNGVAFHNADLSWGMRRLIEEHYMAGNLQVLVCTSTLGEGVNLTGKNVIQIPEMVREDEWTGEYHFVPLSRARFRNQGGRAGRLGLETGFGRSILLAAGEEQAQRLMREYIHGELEPLRPPLVMNEIMPFILDLVSSHICRNSEDISRFLLQTYSGLSAWSTREPEFVNTLQGQIQKAVDKSFLAVTKDGDLSTTGMGDVTAITGLLPETSVILAGWLKDVKGDTPGEFESLLVVSLTPDSYDFHLPVSRGEKRNINPIEIIREHIPAERLESLPFLEKIISRPGGFTEQDFSSLKKTLILLDWIGSADTLAIEERFGILSGAISRLADHFSWIVQSCADFSQALSLPKRTTVFLGSLALRLRLGLEEKGLGLSSLNIAGLERSHLQVLIREGFDTPEALKDADPEYLKGILPESAVCAILDELGCTTSPGEEKSEKESNQPEKIISIDCDPAPQTSPGTEADPPLLLFRLSETGMVECCGRKIHLTPLPYNLLLTLARRPGELVSYIMIDEEVWPQQKVERQQISFHRAFLVRALSGILGKKQAGKLIKTFSGQGLMLNLMTKDVIILQ
jgi:helicase